MRYEGLWAEPEPEKPKEAFYVQIREHRAEVNEIEMEVKEIFKDEDLELLAKCVEAEAGNQGYLGKRLVCDVVLNRASSPEFPDTIEEVINQPGQFSVVANGMIDKVEPSDDTWEAIANETEYRTDAEILYFRTGKYSEFGEPAYQVDDHYFSK